VIWHFGKAEYFFERGWTRSLQNSPTGKSAGMVEPLARSRPLPSSQEPRPRAASRRMSQRRCAVRGLWFETALRASSP
jgi:hypothetical protein